MRWAYQRNDNRMSLAEYLNNLRFFVKHGMRPGDGCDYIIVVQQAGQLSQES